MGLTIPEPLPPAVRARMSPEALEKWDRWYREQLEAHTEYSRDMLWVCVPLFLGLLFVVVAASARLFGWWRP